MLLLRKVWAWVKRYWRYLLFPVGIVLGIVSMLASRREVVVTSPSEVTEAEKERLLAAAEAHAKKAALEKERAAKVKEIEQAYRDTLDRLTEEQKGQVEELREDPDKLNEFLLQVGKDIRG